MTARHALTILAVSDVTEAKRFYHAAFGWTVTVEAPVYVELALPAGMRLGLYQREAFARNTNRTASGARPGESTSTELYLYVGRLSPSVARAIDAGAELLSAAAQRDWGDEVAYLVDPDGNVLALAAGDGNAIP